MIPALFRSPAMRETQLTNWPCRLAPSAQAATRSEIVQPPANNVLVTLESQPSMTTVAFRLESGHWSSLSAMPSPSLSTENLKFGPKKGIGPPPLVGND